jgi:hypothetical protein
MRVSEPQFSYKIPTQMGRFEVLKLKAGTHLLATGTPSRLFTSYASPLLMHARLSSVLGHRRFGRRLRVLGLTSHLLGLNDAAGLWLQCGDVSLIAVLAFASGISLCVDGIAAAVVVASPGLAGLSHQLVFVVGPLLLLILASGHHLLPRHLRFASALSHLLLFLGHLLGVGVGVLLFLFIRRRRVRPRVSSSSERAFDTCRCQESGSHYELHPRSLAHMRALL